MTRFHQSAPEGRPDLPGELTLRFGPERFHCRVHWPAAISAPPLIFLLIDARAGDAFGPSLSSVGGAVVISFPPLRERPGDRLEAAALGWAAVHALDLGADPQLLLVAGVDVGAELDGLVRCLRLSATDEPPTQRRSYQRRNPERRHR